MRADILDDRWILRARDQLLATVEASRAACFLTFTGGLCLEFAGPATLHRGPATGPFVRTVTRRSLTPLVGVYPALFVLFRSGAVRVVFSTGDRLIVNGADAAIRCFCPGEFSWACEHGEVETALKR